MFILLVRSLILVEQHGRLHSRSDAAQEHQDTKMEYLNIQKLPVRLGESEYWLHFLNKPKQVIDNLLLG